MEQAAQRGLEEGWESQKELICTQAEEYLESRALTWGSLCRAVVEGRSTKRAFFSVKKAEILPAASSVPRKRRPAPSGRGKPGAYAGEQVIIGEGERDMEKKWTMPEYIRKAFDRYKYVLLVCCIGLVLAL